MERKYIVMAIVFGGLALALLIGLLTRVDIDVMLSSRDETPKVKIDDARFEVEVADTERLRDRGLAGRRYLEERRGMLYIPDRLEVGPDGPAVGDYWMRGMLFPLDYIWIDSSCRVVDLTVNARVPAPGTPNS